MRSAWRGLVGLFLILLLVVSGLRWLTQRGAYKTFPLPAQNGQWSGISFWDWTSQNSQPIKDRLEASPNILPGSVERQRVTYGQAFVFMYLVRGRPQPVAVTVEMVPWQLSVEYYVLEAGWRGNERVPLLRLDDLIAAFGPPNLLGRMGHTVVLTYPTRQLYAEIVPAESDQGGLVRLMPEDSVTRVWVTKPDTEVKTLRFDLPWQTWAGFTAYQF
jgi:hypothetical protein